MTSLNLDGPLYETIYNVVTRNGTVVETHTDRECADKRARELGLRVLKTIQEVTE